MLGFKLTEQITELFEYSSVCFASFFLPYIAWRNFLKNFTVSDIMISMHVLYHITKGIYQFVAKSGTWFYVSLLYNVYVCYILINDIHAYIPTKYH